MAASGASSSTVGATLPGGNTGSQGPSPTEALGTTGGAPPNLKPIIRSIVVSLATDPPGTDRNPPNVVNLAAVAAPDEAWLTVKGGNFVDGSVVMVSGRPATTVFDPASTFLIARLTSAILPKPMEYRVTVVNPGTGAVSNSWMLYAEPEPKWGLLEKVLVGGALVAAALWILWMINAPLPGPLGDTTPAQATATVTAQAPTAAIPPENAAVTGTANPTSPSPGLAADSGDVPSTEPANWQLTWFTMFIILAVFIFGVGRALTGTWKSLLIDERNKQSLSRLQLVLWTGLVTSAIAAAVAWNIHMGAADPLGIQIPQEILLLLGISATALVGSNFIKQEQSKTPTTVQAEKSFNEITSGELTEEGKLAANVSLVQARWTDMFRSEGTNNYPKLDIGKIQLFFFTIVSVLAYAAAFAKTAFRPFEIEVEGMDGSPLGRFEFPSVEGSVVGLLAISSFYYLANKAAKEWN